jgi:hypothetical protein
MEVVVVRQNQANRPTTVTHVGRRWATLDGVRDKFDIVTWKNDSGGYTYPQLTTPERLALSRRHSEVATRLFRCGIRVEQTRDHPDLDALEQMAAIAEAGMPGARQTAAEEVPDHAALCQSRVTGNSENHCNCKEKQP